MDQASVVEMASGKDHAQTTLRNLAHGFRPIILISTTNELKPEKVLCLCLQALREQISHFDDDLIRSMTIMAYGIHYIHSAPRVLSPLGVTPT